MSVIGELLVKLGLDSKGLTAGMAAAEAETRKFGSSGLGGLTSGLRGAERAALTEAGAVEKSGVKAAESAAKHANLGKALAGIGSVAGLAPLNAGVSQLDALGTSAEAAGAGLGGMALVAGGVAVAGVAAIGLKSAEAAKQFDDSMMLIQTQAGASAAEVEKMKGSVLGMAGQVGQSPEVLAQALFHVESAGFRGAQAEEVLRTAAEGAAVGHADLTSVTNALAAAMNSGVSGVQNAQQAMGVLNAVVGAGNMTMEDLTAAMGTGVLSTAKNFGVSIQGVGGALAALANQGIPAVDAATMLNSAMRLMSAPTKAAEKDLKSIGLSSTSLATDLRSPGGMVTAIADLKSHMEKAGLTATQQAALLANAFGGKQSTGILTLVGGFDKLKTAQDAVSSGAGGFAAAWATTQADVDQEQKELQSSLAATEVKLGNLFLPLEEAALPVLNNVVEAIGAVVGAVSDWITANGPLLSSIGNVLSSAVAPFSAAIDLITHNMDVFGPIIGGIAVAALGALAIALVPVVISFGALAISVLATLAPFIAIGAAIGAVIYVITHWTQVVAALGPIVQQAVAAVTGFFQNLAGAVGQVFAAIGNLIGQALATIGQVIGNAIDLWVTLYIRIPERIASFVLGVVQHFVDLAARGLAVVTGFVGSVVGFILGIPARIVGLIAGVVGTFVRMEAQGLSNIVGFVANVVTTILSIPAKIIGGLVTGFANAAAAAVQAFMGIITGLPAKVAAALGNIGGSIAGAVGNAISSVIPHFDVGSWNIPATTLAVVHQGEMILPAGTASAVRSGVASVGGQAAPAPQNTTVINLTVNNPTPEPASTSTRRELQKLTAFGYSMGT